LLLLLLLFLLEVELEEDSSLNLAELDVAAALVRLALLSPDSLFSDEGCDDLIAPVVDDGAVATRAAVSSLLTTILSMVSTSSLSLFSLLLLSSSLSLLLFSL
jgi:hypothetical protein